MMALSNVQKNISTPSMKKLRKRRLRTSLNHSIPVIYAIAQQIVNDNMNTIRTMDIYWYPPSTYYVWDSIGTVSTNIIHIKYSKEKTLSTG